MNIRSLDECVRQSVERYLQDLQGQTIAGMYDMVVQAVERPLLEVVLARAEGNQSLAAEWLGIHRNTLRKKLQQYRLL